MEVGHGKGPCDPIGGTTTRKANLAVKNEKLSFRLYKISIYGPKKTEDTISIKYSFCENYEQSASKFLETGLNQY